LVSKTVGKSSSADFSTRSRARTEKRRPLKNPAKLQGVAVSQGVGQYAV